MLVKIMNKKAGIEIDKLLWVLLGVMGVVTVAILIWNSTGKTKDSLNTFQESIKPDKNLCNINPCNFQSDKSEKQKERSCFFLTPENLELHTKANTQCF